MSDNKLLCVNCITGFTIPGEPKGKMEKIGPLDTYVSQPSSGSPKSDVALVFNCDAFGLDLKNNKIIPDRLADSLGVTVFTPDYFKGNPAPETMLDGQPTNAKDKRDQGFFAKVAGMGKMLPKAIPWFISHQPSKTFPDMTQFLQVLKTEKGYSKLGAIGYCYGGKIVAEFSKQGQFDVSVLCHPSMLSVQDIKDLKSPALFCCAEEDEMFGAKFREQSKKILEDRQGFVSEFKVYENTVHGFAARPDLSNEKVKAGFEGAFNDSVAFFEKHLLSTPTSSAAAPQPTSTETPAAVQTEATQATEA